MAASQASSEERQFKERAMRFTGLALVASALLGAMTAPAQAAWQGYISHPLGFAFAAPGELKVEKGSYSGAVAGTHDTLVYHFADDGIEYKVVVIDVTAQGNQAANLLGEAEYLFQDKKKLLVNTIDHFDRQYGRKLTIDLPNDAGRTTAAFYFVKGHIISLQATVLPANGDYESPEMGRFVDSITFYPEHAPDDAIELPPPPK
jgi:hypothetical protein